jgi:hypothetical protein
VEPVATASHPFDRGDMKIAAARGTFAADDL